MPIMATSIRRIVQLLLITLLVNAGGWTFNGAAVADVFFQETQQNDAAAMAEEPKSCTTKTVCNHWCHAVSHFVGFFPQPPDIIPAGAASDRFAAKRLIILPLLPAGHFRPPRLLS